MQGNIKKYFYFNAISISILINTFLGGQPYQTFSSRNWEWKRNNRFNVVWLIDTLIFFENNHCMECWIRWKIGRYAVMRYDKREAAYETRNGQIDFN